jgi:hypothetical protein
MNPENEQFCFNFILKFSHLRRSVPRFAERVFGFQTQHFQATQQKRGWTPRPDSSLLAPPAAGGKGMAVVAEW